MIVTITEAHRSGAGRLHITVRYDDGTTQSGRVISPALRAALSNTRVAHLPGRQLEAPDRSLMTGVTLLPRPPQE